MRHPVAMTPWVRVWIVSHLGDQIHEIHKSFKKNVLGASLRAGHRAWRGACRMWALSCEHY